MPERDTWGGLFVLVLMYLSVVLDRLWLCVHGFICLFCVFSTDWKTVDWVRMYFQSGCIWSTMKLQCHCSTVQNTSVPAILRLFIKWVNQSVFIFKINMCLDVICASVCVYRLANEYLLQNQSTLFQKQLGNICDHNSCETWINNFGVFTKIFRLLLQLDWKSFQYKTSLEEKTERAYEQFE